MTTTQTEAFSPNYPSETAMTTAIPNDLDSVHDDSFNEIIKGVETPDEVVKQLEREIFFLEGQLKRLQNRHNQSGVTNTNILSLNSSTLKTYEEMIANRQKILLDIR